MWKTVKLGDVCLTTDYVANGSFASLKENVKYLHNDGYAILVRLTDFTKKWQNPFRYVSKHAYEFLKHSKLIPGDLIISNVGEPGKTFLIPDLGKPMTLGPNSVLIRPDNKILSTKYLKYFLDSAFGQKLIQSIESGTTQRKFNKTSFRNLEITIPTLTEQQRIVAKLDGVFAEVDKLNDAEELNKKNTIALEANLLHLLLQNIDKEKSTFTLSKLIDMGWIEGHLDGNHGNDYPRKNEFVDNGIPYLSANCIVNGEIEPDNQKYLTEERASKFRKGVAINNDILFAHNATVGPTAILKTDYSKVILSTSLTYYRCKKNVIYPEYLLAYMNSKYFKSQYEAVMRQATRNQVPITKQREFFFIIPNYELQVKIAETMYVARKNTKIIFNSRLKKIDNLNSLKSKILTNKLQSDAA